MKYHYKVESKKKREKCSQTAEECLGSAINSQAWVEKRGTEVS